MKFTHNLNIHEGWIETSNTPSDFKEVKHLGECSFDGDMFATYNDDAIIEIFKGTMEEELTLEQRIKNLEDKIF